MTATTPAGHATPVSPEAAPTVSGTSRSAELPVLDTLRAVGAIAVVATHCGFNAGIYNSYGAGGRFLARMDIGVALFFVLSGFLLARPWLARAAAGIRAPGTLHYARKRVLRIYPVYVVCVVISLVLIPQNSGRGPVDWLVTLGMGDIYVSDRLPYGLTQTWSLATEVAFYVVLPLLMLLAVGRSRTLRPGRVVAVLVGMVAINCAWLLDLSARVNVSGGHVNEWLPAYLTWFAAGIGLALVHVVPERSDRLHRWLSAAGSSPGSCAVIALGLLLVAGTSVAGPTALIPATEQEALTKNLLYVVIALLIVVPGVFGASTSTYARVMSHPWPRHLGQISYGIFLIHMPLLQLVMWMTGYTLFDRHFPEIFGLTLLLSVVSAEILYRLVELPFLRLKGREPGAPTKKAARPSASRTA